MFENFKKIQIEGGYFEQSTGFDLFDSNQCLSIIYGRNGSGKTSIAKAMRQLVGKDSEPKEDDGSVQYTVSSDQAIPDDKKTSVFIFDEEFVRENVRTKGKGLETIVMMGEQVDLDTQITIKKTEISVIDNKMAEQIALKEKYEKASDTSSPQYFFNRIRDGLREDGGWADIDRDIKGNTVKSRVTEDFVIRLASLEEPKETEDVLRQQLRHDFELFAKTEDALVIDWKATELKLPRNLNEAKALLEKRVERPVLSEREIKLMSFLQEHIVYHSFDTTRQLTEEKWPFCPLCLRETSNEDYEHISDTLKRILNRESEAYSKELDSMISSFDDVEFSMPEFPNDLNEKEKKCCTTRR